MLVRPPPHTPRVATERRAAAGVLASGRDGVLKIFDLRTYEATHTFGGKDMVASINHYKACMSPDGKYVAAGARWPLCCHHVVVVLVGLVFFLLCFIRMVGRVLPT